KTSATMTLLLPLIAKVSGICTYTVYPPPPPPGPPGGSTFEMPRQPHELSTIAATENTRPCQIRWRTLLIVTRITGSRFGLLLARSALVVRLTGPLLVRMPPPRVARGRRGV